MASEDVIRLKLSTHNGLELLNPSGSDIREALRGLGADNMYVLLERFDANSRPWAAGFAQVGFPLPGEEGWTVEYREGGEQFQANTKDLAHIERLLSDYATGRAGWKEGLDWQLFMTHDA